MIERVWFKRDLRMADHAPLALAAQNSAALPLAMVESEYCKLPGTSSRHYLFWRENLTALAMTACRSVCVKSMRNSNSVLKLL